MLALPRCEVFNACMPDDFQPFDGDPSLHQPDVDPAVDGVRRDEVAEFIAEVIPTDAELLTPREVADLFSVHPKTVVQWAEKGLLHPIRTIGGTRRYPSEEIKGILRRQLESGD